MDAIPPGAPEEMDGTAGRVVPQLPSVENYVIVRTLGHGGMADVYLAEQTHPVHRSVALKVVRAGPESEVLDRFGYERDILAEMAHPSIARILDAGMTRDGRPFFALEYIDGVSITEHCDKVKMPIKERLELFCGVLGAIRHAHQRGIIHRDLKPSNILITLVDGRAIPKIIDFGIARALESSVRSLERPTRAGILVGTLEYMSPEQARSGKKTVDTRTDVYSLGVVLYELLTGALPLEPPDPSAPDPEQYLRSLREIDPPVSSERLRAHGQDIEAVARDRDATAPGLLRAVRGDLDWILVRALSKSPEKRYASAAEFERDIRRHLEGRPIIARPPSALYQLSKMVLRHRLAFTLATGVVLLLAATAVAMTIDARRIAREKARADAEADAARRTAAFLMGLFQVSDPTSDEGKSLTVRQLLDRGARDIRDQLKDQPVTRAEMLDTIGMAYRSLGVYSEAEPYLRESLEIRVKTGGNTSSDLASSKLHLGQLLYDEGQFDKAEAELRDALEQTRKTDGEGSAATAECDFEIGRLLTHKGKYAEAEPFLIQAKAIQEKTLGPESREVSKTINSLAMLCDYQGKRDEAEGLYKRVMAIDEKTMATTNPARAVAYSNLAELYRVEGRYSEAEPLYLKTLAIFEKTLDPDHPNIATIYNNLGLLYRAEKRYPAAEKAFLRCKQTLVKVLPPGHPYLATMTNNIGGLKLAEGDLKAAEPLLREALAMRQRIFHGDNPDIAESLFNLAMLKEEQGHLTEAVPLYDQALQMRKKTLGENHALVGKTLERYAGILRKMGRDQQAQSLEEEAKAIASGAAATNPGK
jgi:eukaryotic-like serine/threonine-protein kinase